LREEYYGARKENQTSDLGYRWTGSVSIHRTRDCLQSLSLRSRTIALSPLHLIDTALGKETDLHTPQVLPRGWWHYDRV